MPEKSPDTFAKTPTWFSTYNAIHLFFIIYFPSLLRSAVTKVRFRARLIYFKIISLIGFPPLTIGSTSSSADIINSIIVGASV